MQYDSQSVRELMLQLKNNPNDVDLITEAAIACSINAFPGYSPCELFRLAYQTEQSIKTAHNLAYCIYDIWDYEKVNEAINIQMYVMSRKPSSYPPYLLMGTLLLYGNQPERALEYLLIAERKHESRVIRQSIGACYYKMGDLEKSYEAFKLAANGDDKLYRSRFCLAVVSHELGRLQETEAFGEKLYGIALNRGSTWSGDIEMDVCFIYCMIGDYKKAVSLWKPSYLEAVEVSGFLELSYSLYKANKALWLSVLEKEIDNKKRLIESIRTSPASWCFDSEEEKQDDLERLNSDILDRQRIIETGVSKPPLTLDDHALLEHPGCLLFGCSEHRNLFNDETGEEVRQGRGG